MDSSRTSSLSLAPASFNVSITTTDGIVRIFLEIIRNRHYGLEEDSVAISLVHNILDFVCEVGDKVVVNGIVVRDYFPFSKHWQSVVDLRGSRKLGKLAAANHSEMAHFAEPDPRLKRFCPLCCILKQHGENKDPKNPPHVCVVRINMLASFVVHDDDGIVVWYRIAGYDGRKWIARCLENREEVRRRTVSKEQVEKLLMMSTEASAESDGLEPDNYRCGRCRALSVDPNSKKSHECPFNPPGSNLIIGLFGGNIEVPMLAFPDQERTNNNRVIPGGGGETNTRENQVVDDHDYEVFDVDDLDKKPAAKRQKRNLPK